MHPESNINAEFMKKIFYSIVTLIAAIAMVSCASKMEFSDYLMGDYVMTQTGDTTIIKKTTMVGDTITITEKVEKNGLILPLTEESVDFEFILPKDTTLNDSIKNDTVTLTSVIKGSTFRADGAFVGTGGLLTDNSLYFNPQDEKDSIKISIDKFLFDINKAYHVYNVQEINDTTAHELRTVISFTCTLDSKYAIEPVTDTIAIPNDTVRAIRRTTNIEYILSGTRRYVFTRTEKTESTATPAE